MNLRFPIRTVVGQQEVVEARVARRQPLHVRPVLGDDEGEAREAVDWRAVAAGGELEQQALLLFGEGMHHLWVWWVGGEMVG